MAIKRTISKSCCGGSNGTVMFYLDKTLTKNVLIAFENANLNIPDGEERWIIPPHYEKSGIFYVRKNGLVATTSFGTTRITIKVGAHERDKKLDEFEKILELGLNS